MFRIKNSRSLFQPLFCFRVLYEEQRTNMASVSSGSQSDSICQGIWATLVSHIIMEHGSQKTWPSREGRWLPVSNITAFYKSAPLPAPGHTFHRCLIWIWGLLWKYTLPQCLLHLMHFDISIVFSFFLWWLTVIPFTSYLIKMLLLIAFFTFSRGWEHS